MRLIVVVTCLLVAACAAIQPRATPRSGPPGPHEVRSARSAADAIAIGKSTKDEVRAALGEAVVVDFDSGYAVWVYKESLNQKTKPPTTELVLLFDPSGVLAKTRVR